MTRILWCNDLTIIWETSTCEIDVFRVHLHVELQTFNILVFGGVGRIGRCAILVHHETTW